MIRTAKMVARKIYSDGGVPAFFAGVGVGACQSAIEKGIYFFAYSLLKSAASSILGAKQLSTPTSLVLGYCAEWSHMPVTLPIEVVCKTMQTRKPGKGEAGGGSSGGGVGNGGVFGVISAILKEKGVGGFYRGLSAYIVLCLKPAIQFTIYEQLRLALLKRRAGPGGAANNKMKQLSTVQVYSSNKFSC